MCPPARTLPVAWAPPMAARELGAAAVHHRRPRGRDRLAARRSPSAWSKASAGRARRSAPTATTSTSRTCVAPDLVVLVADAGLGTINAVRLSVGAARRLPGGRRAQPLRRRRAAARPQPRAPDRDRRLRRRHRTPRARRPGARDGEPAHRSPSGSRANARRASTASRSRPTACHELVVPRRAACSSSTTPGPARRSPTTTTAPPAPRSSTDADDVWARADLVLKVKEPQPDELDRAPTRARAVHLPPPRRLPGGRRRAARRTASPASPTRRCSSTTGALPLLAPMSEVAGRMAPQIGAALPRAPSTAGAACCSAAHRACGRRGSSCSAPATSGGTRRGSRRAWRPRCSCSTRTSTACAGSTRSTRAAS